MSINYFSDLKFICHGEMQTAASEYVRDDFSYWGLQFSLRGHFRLQINDNAAESTHDAAVFVTFPGARFAYGPAPGEKIENKLYICFAGDRVKRYLEGGMLQERRNDALIKLSEGERFMRKMRSIRALLMRPFSNENHARAVLALEQLLLEMQSSQNNSFYRCDQRYEAFEALTEKIAASPELPWNFEKEARKLSVSYAHFRRLFEQFFQVPPGAFLLSARLEKAAGLLSGTTSAIRQIAHECGFEDEFYFSRIFKKYRNISPKLYREKHR